MNEQLLALRDISNLVIGRSKQESYDTENLLSKPELDIAKTAEHGLRMAALKLSAREDPLCKPYVLDLLSYILRMCVQVNSHRTALLVVMPAGVPLPVVQEVYDFELRLTRLFAWLLKTFPHLINSNQPLPPLFLEDNLGAVATIRDRARSKFRKCRIESRLTEITVKPFTDFLSRNYKLRYHEFKYLYYFRKDFTTFLGAKKFTNESISTFLHEQNNNSTSFLNWQVAQLRSQAMKRTTPALRILYYCDSFRNARQHVQNLTHPLQSGIGSVTLIQNWILAEIDYLEKELLYNVHPTVKEQVGGSARLRLETNFSVAELSCFFNLLYKCSLVNPQSKAGLMRFVAHNFKTLRTDNISDVSLLRKTIGIETATKTRVKNKLVKMLNKLREEED